VLEDAERLIAAWNERQIKRMPMLADDRRRDCRAILVLPRAAPIPRGSVNEMTEVN
jgi:hypothetical protein